MRQMRRLTPEQRKIVEDNHNLIYAYCGKHKISVDDFYDIFAIALCEAAMHYDGSSAFSTYCYVSFRYAYLKEKTYMTRAKRLGENDILHYDNIILNSENRNKEDTYESFMEDVRYNTERVYEVVETVREIDDMHMTQMEKDIWWMLKHEVPTKEIRAALGCSTQCISALRCKAREFAKRKGFV